MSSHALLPWLMEPLMKDELGTRRPVQLQLAMADDPGRLAAPIIGRFNVPGSFLLNADRI